MKKAMIAMSGGVDSSVAALIMKERGYDCCGATMRLFQNEDAGVPREHSCCTLDDVRDARNVAASLGMKHYVFNFTADFKEQVINRFIRAYENGATPNPCIDCNRYMKFKKLFERAEILGCDCIVTGHYARIEESDGRFLLKKAVDESKDQSYVLYSMTQEELARTVLPLGSLRKSEVRAIAEEHGFINAAKPDSQDICFVPDGDYAKIIELMTGKNYPKGNFVDTDGNVLGTHNGIIRYTVGQRKGLGIALGEPMYVREVRAAENEVVLARDSELYSRGLEVSEFNWIALNAPQDSFRAKVKIRYRQREQDAEVIPTGVSTVRIVFDEPQRAVTPGQAAVVYDGDTVVGGGVIVRGEKR